MAKKRGEKKKVAREGAPPRGESSEGSLCSLLVEGDYRAARQKARTVLDDPASSQETRSVAHEALARSGLDPAALTVGLIALAVVSTLFFAVAWH